jgi:hypothetical protein
VAKSSLAHLPFSGVSAAVYVKHFTRDECCIVEIHHRINDLVDFAHSADRLKTFQKVMGFHLMHWRSYGSESDRVDANALSCIFDLAKPRDSGVRDFLGCCALTYIAIHECEAKELSLLFR